MVEDGKWGTKVDREHRRRQTGSNWRKPASRLPSRRRRPVGGEIGEHRGAGDRERKKERERKSAREACQESDTEHANKFRTPYTARRRVALASLVDPVWNPPRQIQVAPRGRCCRSCHSVETITAKSTHDANHRRARANKPVTGSTLRRYLLDRRRDRRVRDSNCRFRPVIDVPTERA